MTRKRNSARYGFVFAVLMLAFVTMACSSSGGGGTTVTETTGVSGALDTGFGAGGKATTAIGASDDVANAVAVQPDGKIVVAGYSYNGSNNDFAVVRYNADGSLDTGFGAGGKATTAIGAGDDVANAVAIQPDGNIVAAGFADTGSDYDFAVVRYNTNGSLDTNFNITGKVTTAMGVGDDVAHAVAIQPNGKVVVAGFADSGTSSNFVFALARYNDDGSLNTTFNTGKVTTAIGGSGDFSYGMAIQPDGKIVAVGSSVDGSTYNDVFALARYNANGTLDAGFNTTGKVTTPIIGSGDFADSYGMAIQGDGNIVVAGHSFTDGKDVFALARYLATGAMDTTFGTSGIVTTAVGTGDAVAKAVAIQPDGKIVAVGSAYNGSNNFFAVVRYNR